MNVASRNIIPSIFGRVLSILSLNQTVALIFLAFTAMLVVSGCSVEEPVAPRASDAALQSSSNLHTFILASATDARLPAPMNEAQRLSSADLAFLKGAHASSKNLLTSAGDPATFWNQLTTELGLAAHLPPPLFARAYALVHVAVYDALVAAHTTPRSDLIDRTIAAGAASTVLVYLFPTQAGRIMADAASQVGADHGLALGRVTRSWGLGKSVGDVAVDHGRHDGSDAVFTGIMPTGDGIWTGTHPVLPMCGTWKTWITTSGSEFQPEPPYRFGSTEDLLEVLEVFEVSLHRTPEQIAIVHKWADLPPPTIWNNSLNSRIASYGLNTFAAARAHAYLNAGMYDAFVSCWETKYTYWIARPFQRTPELETVIPTPNFPGYTSGHSTVSSCASKVMGELFPVEAVFFQSQAEEAALSRLLGGIHFTHDNNQGLVVGAQIGNKVVGIMRADVALPLLASH
ncbi:MAG: hypothetical protein HYR76_11740 [Ignavibacteria bacterium]|nr:hypothetical protein [Ignavibacteria bacterium]MBI3766509.1 hypothetical protein [Ignavibacteriales bacterium]